MSRKSSYTVEEKIKACTDYLSGFKSAIQIAIELNMGKHGRGVVRGWVKKYEAYGASVFINKARNNYYSQEFKERVVKEYLNGTNSPNELVIKYNIPSRTTLIRWIKMYNNHIELKEYDPKPEVYMVDTLKTTFEERIEIIKYCLAQGRDIKGTAAKYGCKYAQLYQWVRKYEAEGQTALIDKRGKCKQEDKLSDLEKAERKIAQLEREKEEYRKKYELLKKAEERERW
ncbi:helix-turn-helix domain-containing protein [Aminipila luticellarii]|uniref:Transposase n=1 Tax=Aminipila luticellarii TaxID=2507160 RepID=A0A410PU41_9FIRM|nr:helix-turn-helix domain-containing protein [Aminipila luticellarii]QAT42430.1 transposase [Aminipila luticellarii]